MSATYTQIDHDEFYARMDRQAAEFNRDLNELNKLELSILLMEMAMKAANEQQEIRR